MTIRPPLEGRIAAGDKLVALDDGGVWIVERVGDSVTLISYRDWEQKRSFMGVHYKSQASVRERFKRWEDKS